MKKNNFYTYGINVIAMLCQPKKLAGSFSKVF